MKLAYIELCGFRGYRKPIRLDFAEGFTIIEGRNGVGKSTLFDAVEFALTGNISKYGKTKAAGESVADYLWWVGEGRPPTDRFVEVGFRNGAEEYPIRRTQFGKFDSKRLEALTDKLCDPSSAPQYPLMQLCASSIIRDEHIASLSLDLKEADRYAVLRDALGAIDADKWIGRANLLVSASKRRVTALQDEVTSANNDIAVVSRRIDEVRANLVSESTVSETVSRLQAFANTQLPPDELAGSVRKRIAELNEQIESLQTLAASWEIVLEESRRSSELAATRSASERERDRAADDLRALQETAIDSSVAIEAHDLAALVALGRKIGLKDGHCPLCAKEQSKAEFDKGMAAAEMAARKLDEQAARQAELQQARLNAQARLEKAERDLVAISSRNIELLNLFNSFREAQAANMVGASVSVEAVVTRRKELQQRVEAAQKDLRIIETLKLSAELERAQRREAEAKVALARAQERFGKVLKAQSTAQALYDAARRAAAETLDRRLDRVLPLMSELYQRLRPHPTWSSIEYSIRGDVKRFLKLQVGEELNPQFLFSSGQRRATGLAFLLSVNLALAWNRWQSILLDDPVQHIDDFRTVHLAELMAQLVADNRQIICAVEDAALADLLCRRLPMNRRGEGKRVTLGADIEGDLCKIAEQQLSPLIQRSLFSSSGSVAAG